MKTQIYHFRADCHFNYQDKSDNALKAMIAKSALKFVIASFSIFPFLHFSSPVLAQDKDQDSGIEGFVGAGVLSVPEYEGSEDSEIAPLLSGLVQKGPFYLELQGLKLRANVLPVEVLEIGPSIGFRSGRDDDIENGRW
ncbi:MAG: MipA/OmpV family protein [Cyanobacteria bacterium J06621_8]